MAWIYVLFIVAALVAFTIIWLWHVERGLSKTPPEALKFSPDRWTDDQIREAQSRYQDLQNVTDVRPFLFVNQQRRYIVCGGSGLVGGWIVQHLLMRGEDPAAIRILDLVESQRPEVKQNNIQFFVTDVSDRSSVDRAFDVPWDERIARLPLTVFHTAAYIFPADRKPDFMTKYIKVNIQGTQHVVDASKRAGATCLIATSSGSIGMKVIKPFFSPWKNSPDHWFHRSLNADPPSPTGGLDDFASCYAYSKTTAENIVRDADDPRSGFRTGSIRPSHAIYGHGIESSSSFLYDYLRRGGSPSWIHDIITNLVNAQNVSIAHLAFENTLINDPKSSVGGNAYCATDPNPPITYGDAYQALALLSHPLHPSKFPRVPAVPMILLAHIIETYTVLRHRHLRFLPPITGDLAMMQPAMIQMCHAHLVYDDSRAYKEIGYRGALTTLEGVILQVLYFNDRVEEKLQRQSDGENRQMLQSAGPNPVPAPPKVR